MIRTGKLCEIFGEPLHWFTHLERSQALPFAVVSEGRGWREFSSAHLLALGLMRHLELRLGVPAQVGSKSIRQSGIAKHFLERLDEGKPVDGLALHVPFVTVEHEWRPSLLDLTSWKPTADFDGGAIVRVYPVWRYIVAIARQAGVTLDGHLALAVSPSSLAAALRRAS